MSDERKKHMADQRPVLTPDDVLRLQKEGEELRREIERRVAPMKQVSGQDLKLRTK